MGSFSSALKTWQQTRTWWCHPHRLGNLRSEFRQRGTIADVDSMIPVNVTSNWYGSSGGKNDSTGGAVSVAPHAITAGVSSFTTTNWYESPTTLTADVGATTFLTEVPTATPGDTLPIGVVSAEGNGIGIYLGPTYVGAGQFEILNAAKANPESASNITNLDKLLDNAVTFAATTGGPVSAPTDANAAANAVNENVAVGTAVGITAQSTGGIATITYSLTNNDGGRFAINSSTGVVSTAAAIDAEALGAGNLTRSITVQATDGTTTASQSFSITVNDLNDNSPVITSNGGGATATVSIPENTTAVTTVHATDADVTAPNNTVTYSKSGTDAGFFTIVPSTGVLTFTSAPDFENGHGTPGGSNSYAVTVTASDGVNVTNQVLTVNVTDVSDAAVSIDGSGNLVIAGEANANNLSMSVNGSGQFVLTLTGGTLVTSLGSGTGSTVTIPLPLAGFTTNTIIYNADGGTDNLTLDTSVIAAGLNVNYDGGTGTGDSMTLTGTNFDGQSAVYSMTDPGTSGFSGNY